MKLSRSKAAFLARRTTAFAFFAFPLLYFPIDFKPQRSPISDRPKSMLYGDYAGKNANEKHFSFVVLSGKSTWDKVGKQGWLTWHKHVADPHRLVIASNVKLDELPEGVVYLQDNVAGFDEYIDSQRRFLDVILHYEMQRGEYLFLLDDDVFVVTKHALRLLRDHIPHVEMNKGSIYGQVTCGTSLCGGAGAVFSPLALKTLRNHEDIIWSEYFNVSTEYAWDVVLSNVVRNRINGVELINFEGYFNGQPPNFLNFTYGGGNFGIRFPARYDRNPESLRRLGELPVTFHYVDEYHQAKHNETYTCGICSSLIPGLYENFYDREKSQQTSKQEVQL